jgi:O-antigen/teichoic acid export membrane protein
LSVLADEPPAEDMTTKSAERSIFSRVIGNAGRLLMGKVAAGVLSFAALTMATRALGVAGFGVLLLIHTCATAFSVATRLQSWQPLLHFGAMPYERGESAPFQTLLRRCLMLDFGGAAFGAVLAVVFSLLFGPHIGWPATERIPASLYMTAVLFMNTGCAMGVLRLSDRFGRAMLGDVAAAWCRCLGAAAGLLLHWGLWAYLAVWYAALVTSFVTDHIMAWRALRTTPACRGFRLLARAETLRLTGFWRGLLATSANFWLDNLEGRLVILLLGAFLGPSPAAIFSVTRDVCDALGHPAELISPAAYPELIRLRERRDWAGIRRVTAMLLKSLGGFSLLLLGVCALFGPTIIGFALDQGRDTSLTLLMLLAGATVLDLWDAPLEPLLLSFGQAPALLKGRLIGMAAGIALLCFLSKLLGLTGAGLACLLAELLILCSRLLPALRLMRHQ